MAAIVVGAKKTKDYYCTQCGTDTLAAATRGAANLLHCLHCRTVLATTQSTHSTHGPV